ncbi:CBASS oligonucleotide cyclase [Kordiimonas lipolytica]|uniref:CBASS oligonucleotide cyclase n=1 Tax=Kordiimonas lipolytica TaxID=1662421 RepID=A0ABV8UAP9_9PROT|nr:CBASS oligonucleotide cyclase [Kordiimonas lipolytica]
MGGGGGGYYSEYSGSQIQKKIEQTTDELAKGFGEELQRLLNEVLPGINDRDADGDMAIREELRGIISEAIDSPLIRLRFGGSVSKNTYVEGLSDIDALAVFRNLTVKDSNPANLLARIAANINAKLEGCEVRVGAVAVTVTRPDGKEFQIIPAVRDGTKLRVPSWDGKGWSGIDLRKFSKTLSKYNANLNQKLIPTIKLAKKVLAELPPSRHLSGYHVEALAVDVFKRYKGEPSTSSMLPYFFDRASKAILRPITDSSGQSVHVDEYLGAQNSVKRKEMSHLLNRISKRMMNASAFQSRDRWEDILGVSYE